MNASIINCKDCEVIKGALLGYLANILIKN